MIFYMVMFYMILFILMLFIMYMYMMVMKLTLFIEFDMVSISSVNLELLILVDWVALLFSSVVIFISLMVIYYSMEYMSLDLNINRFLMLIMMFVLSMMLLIFMPNMISILLGWDGLGLVSYCLVIYYQNMNSYNSGMVTFLINRVGDILILMSIALFLMLGSWNYYFLSEVNILIYMLLMVASFTKSAQIPFSSWLPLAMAAPTPVSSLVHSSTLVTAGVYLLIRLNYLLHEMVLINIMLMVSVITMFMSGLGANFEFDLKKIIALSTLSQLGVMIFCLSMNLMTISLFHLLTHAMFKSMLFMCAGIIIHNMMNYQDIRMISMTTYNLPLISMMFNCSSMSLCGIPFLSGFFSKDLILEMFLMSFFNKFILMILFISMGFTVMYTLRLFYYSFIKIPHLSFYFKFKCMNSKMSISMYLLFFMSIMKGLILSWMLFSMKNLIYLTFMFKLMIYFFMLMGMGLGYYFINFYINCNILLYCNKYLKYFMMLCFMPLLYSSVSPKLFSVSLKLNFLLDYGWLEYLGGGEVKLLLSKIYNLDYYKNYLYMIIMFLFLICIMIF